VADTELIAGQVDLDPGRDMMTSSQIAADGA